jgi:hypothetical protein
MMFPFVLPDRGSNSLVSIDPETTSHPQHQPFTAHVGEVAVKFVGAMIDKGHAWWPFPRS